MDKMSWVTIGIDAVVAFIVGVLGAAVAPSASAKVVNFFYARKVSRSLKTETDRIGKLREN
jgi:hypothetical protein